MTTSDFRVLQNGLNALLRPRLENPHMDNPRLVFVAQSNTKKLNTNEVMSVCQWIDGRTVLL